MEIQAHNRMRKTDFAENSVSFVTRSDIRTCDVFTANNIAMSMSVSVG